VLQGFEGFVGFYRAALIAVLPGAVFPLLDIELKFLAFRGALGMGVFCGSEFRARDAQLGVGLEDALRKSVQLCAQCGDLVVDALKLNQVRNRRMHV
jgi:hypothetical protein